MGGALSVLLAPGFDLSAAFLIERFQLGREVGTAGRSLCRALGDVSLVLLLAGSYLSPGAFNLLAEEVDEGSGVLDELARFLWGEPIIQPPLDGEALVGVVMTEGLPSPPRARQGCARAACD